jgi:hypothetical protein
VEHSKLTFVDAVVAIPITTAVKEGETKAKATVSSLPLSFISRYSNVWIEPRQPVLV